MSEFIIRLSAMLAEKRLYALATLPTHMAEAGQIDRLVCLLTELDFIEAKCSEHMAIGLLQDYSSSLAGLTQITGQANISRSVTDFESFVRSQLHVLRTYPELTFQQAANQPNQSAPESCAYDRWHSGKESRSWVRWLNKSQYKSDVITVEVSDEHVLCAEVGENQREVFLGTESGLLWRIDLLTGRMASRSLPDKTSVATKCVLLPLTGYLLLATHTGKLIGFDGESSQWDGVWTAHVGRISSMALSLDGSKLLTAGEDGKICLWTLEGKNIRDCSVIHEEKNRIVSIAFALHDHVIAIGTSSGLLRLLNERSGWKQFYSDQKHYRAITCCTTTDRGSTLWTGSSDGSVRTLRIADNLAVQTILVTRFGPDVTSLASISDDHLSCAVGLAGGAYRISLRDKSVRQLSGHEKRIIYLKYTSRAKELLLVDAYGTVKAQHAIPTGPQQDKQNWYLKAMGWLSDGCFLYTLSTIYAEKGLITFLEKRGSVDMRLRIYEASSGKLVAEHDIPSRGSYRYGVKAEAGLFLRAFAEEKRYGVRLYDIWTMQEKGELVLDDSVQRIIADERGWYCLTEEDNGQLKAWDLRSCTMSWSKQVHTRMHELWLDSVSNSCGWAEEYDTASTVELTTGLPVDSTLEPQKSHFQFEYGRILYYDEDNRTHTVCFVPKTGKITWYLPVQNDRIVVATDNGLISAVCADGRVLGSLSNQTSVISPVRLGSNLLTISRDNWLIIWNTERCRVETRFPIPGVAQMFSVYADKRLIAVGVNSEEFLILELEV